MSSTFPYQIMEGLPLATIGKRIELLPQPTKTVVVLIAFGSLPIGEVLALRWRLIQPIVIRYAREHFGNLKIKLTR